MANYKWTFSNVGGATRVRIQSADDLRHLGELDKKMWTVLSCPVQGLEISADSLSLIDLDGDGKLRIKEVVATADWLCATLNDPNTLFAQEDRVMIDNIANADIKAVAQQVAGKNKEVSLAEVNAAIDAVAITPAAVPAAAERRLPRLHAPSFSAAFRNNSLRNRRGWRRSCRRFQHCRCSGNCRRNSTSPDFC